LLKTTVFDENLIRALCSANSSNWEIIWSGTVRLQLSESVKRDKRQEESTEEQKKKFSPECLTTRLRIERGTPAVLFGPKIRTAQVHTCAIGWLILLLDSWIYPSWIRYSSGWSKFGRGLNWY
jgi:hypothetical protein